ncbi:MAG: sigma-70 family RNA polymerase sigma factor [Eubacterium sp.]|nr:sigma-70 family RNA polymerase sigma factor [Eubacterium sp.]
MTEEQQNKCAELWCLYHDKIRNYCFSRLCGSGIDVDDTVGDVYLALCDQVVKGSFPYDPEKWLYKTAKNIVCEKFRKKYKHDKYVVDIEIDLVDLQSQDDFVDTIEKNEQIQKIAKIIPTMKKNSQEILYRSYFHKTSMKKIAKKIDSTETAVKQKRYYDCRKLEKELK